VKTSTRLRTSYADPDNIRKGGIGIQVDVTNQLRSEIKIDDLEDWQKYVTLVFDEVKIKE